MNGLPFGMYGGPGYPFNGSAGGFGMPINPMIMNQMNGGVPNAQSRPSSFRPGDWMCPGCGDHKHAFRQVCNHCGASKPHDMYDSSSNNAGYGDRDRDCGGRGHDRDRDSGRGGDRSNFRPGDWYCPTCNDHKYAYRDECNRCGTRKPADIGGNDRSGRNDRDRDRDRERDRGSDYGRDRDRDYGGRDRDSGRGGDRSNFRPGDWYCPTCNDHKYAYRDECNRCGTKKPNFPSGGNKKSSFRPGDWICPGCKDHKFAFRDSCEKCNIDKKEEYTQEAESLNRKHIDMGLPENFRTGDWMCPGCNDHKFAFRDVCEKCNTAKPIDESGNVIALVTSGSKGSSDLVEQACDLASKLSRFELKYISPISASMCALKPSLPTATAALLEPISSLILKSLKANTRATMSQLERECNAYSNGLDLMSITEANLEWVTIPPEQLMVHLLGSSDHVLSRATNGLNSNENINADPCAVVPHHSSISHVATRSPLLVFKMANAAGKEVASVAVHVSLDGNDIQALQPEDSQYFYLEIARFSSK